MTDKSEMDFEEVAREISRKAFKLTHEYGDRKDWFNHVIEPLIISSLKAEGDKARNQHFMELCQEHVNERDDIAERFDPECSWCVHHKAIVDAVETGRQEALKAKPILEVEEIYKILVEYSNKTGGFTGPQMHQAHAISAAMNTKHRKGVGHE